MSTAAPLNLADFIRDIPDFPKPGILFRDITPLLQSPVAFQETIRQLAEPFRGQGIDLIAAAEARGFIFAAPLALEINAGLIPIRKPGKLPGKTLSHTYELEYGTDTLQVHADAIIRPGCKVLMVDDLLATGGTIAACCTMIERAGGVVAGCAFVIELVGLQGRRADRPVSDGQFDTVLAESHRQFDHGRRSPGRIQHGAGLMKLPANVGQGHARAETGRIGRRRDLPGRLAAVGQFAAGSWNVGRLRLAARAEANSRENLVDRAAAVDAGDNFLSQIAALGE